MGGTRASRYKVSPAWETEAVGLIDHFLSVCLLVIFLTYSYWKSTKMFLSRYKIYTNPPKSILLEINVNL